MPLTDLIVKKSKLTEEAIEAIVKPYIRYDTEDQTLVFTTQAIQLSKKHKVLVYLVAMQGWQFVQNEAIDLELTPAQLSESLGIQGPTLRPILKDLKDRNLLAEKSRRYAVRFATLDEIMAELGRVEKSAVIKRSKTRKAKKNKNISNSDVTSTNRTARTKPLNPPNRKSSVNTLGTSDAIYKLIENGFFSDGKTAAQLRARLHEQAVMVKRSTLPPYLVALVRKKQLRRKKQEIEGKSVWVYSSAGLGEV